MISENTTRRARSDDAKRVLDFPFVQPRVGQFGLPEEPVTEAMEALGNHFREWSSSVATARMIGGFAVVTVRISASGISREGIGFSEGCSGEGFVAAERRAFCDAVSRFPEIHSERTEESFRAEATSIADLISYRQLREIKALASESGVDADEQAERSFGVSVSELSREAAGRLIELIREPAYGPRAAVQMAG